MNDTVLEQQLVQAYLGQLDAAMRVLPAAQARELREQLTAHLEDTIPPGAGDPAVAATLSQLGAPADLVADATAALGPTIEEAVVATGRRLRARVRRTRGRTKVLTHVHGRPGGYFAIDHLSLRVRVSWFTRTESIRLLQAWALTGPSQGKCP